MDVRGDGWNSRVDELEAYERRFRHAGLIEEAVREQCPTLGDVIVHTEPEEAAVGKQPARPAAQPPPTAG